MRSASYIGGMYPLIGEPAHPELWRGCVGAWAPCLGPTGLTLREWSGYRNHGTLENMVAGSDWVTQNGRYGLDFDGTDDRVTTGSTLESLYDFTDATSKFTITMWAMDRSSTARTSIVLAKGTAASAAGGFYIDLGQGITLDPTQGSVTLYFGSARWTGVSFPFAANVMNHLAVVVDMTLTGTDRCEVYVNGLKTGTKFSQNPLTALAGNNNPITLGNATTNNLPFNGILLEAAIHNRVLSGNEIALMASRVGAMFDLAPRKRSRTLAAFKAYWAARKALIQMAGST